MSDTDRETSNVLRPKWDERGLIQAVASDVDSGELLMVAHMNAAALAATIASGEAHYWSRSRAEVWHKGGTSGHIQTVIELRIDCDQDALWLKVRPSGPACHTGERTCFYRRLDDEKLVREP
ncbi:MAG: phosphoribosyl-AMP cyclohydrolase [Polymorphobacter sp.]